MALKVETLIVNGETITRNGVRERTLATNVKRELNRVLSTVGDDNLVDLKINTEADTAFVTVIYKADKSEDKHSKR